MNDLLIKALQAIAAKGPETMPEEPEFDSFQDAENYGADYTAYELASIAREALRAAGVE